MAEISRWGESFRLNTPDDVGSMPLVEFAQVAVEGQDANDMAGLAAVGNLLDALIVAEDLIRFKRAARKAKASGDDLVGVIKEAIRGNTERPTSRPSDSSDGSPATNEPSAAGSSLPVTRLEAKGRGDLALLVSRAEQSRASA